MTSPDQPQHRDRASNPTYEKRKTVRLTADQIAILNAATDSEYDNESDAIRSAIELLGKELENGQTPELPTE